MCTFPAPTGPTTARTGESYRETAYIPVIAVYVSKPLHTSVNHCVSQYITVVHLGISIHVRASYTLTDLVDLKADIAEDQFLSLIAPRGRDTIHPHTR